MKLLTFFQSLRSNSGLQPVEDKRQNHKGQDERGAFALGPGGLLCCVFFFLCGKRVSGRVWERWNPIATTKNRMWTQPELCKSPFYTTIMSLDTCLISGLWAEQHGRHWFCEGWSQTNVFRVQVTDSNLLKALKTSPVCSSLTLKHMLMTSMNP